MQLSIWEVYVVGLASVMLLFTLSWIISIPIRNVSIVDIFWGVGFVLISIVYFLNAEAHTWRSVLVLIFTIAWGLRLAIHIGLRNMGKGEDYRYVEFRKYYGAHRYWWFSFFQVFMLQGVLLWIISLPLLAVHFFGGSNSFSIVDGLAVMLWVVGFVFETVGDYQLAKFKSNPANKGKVLDSGLWRYTRHPNYFGDAAVWWGYGLFSISVGSWWAIVGSFIMTFLLMKVSGVALLERTLAKTKPQYQQYIQRTSAFFPWFPKQKS